jgi:hypothetical protein
MQTLDPIVQEALSLYKETMPLEKMLESDPEFEYLYGQECKLFDILQSMDYLQLDSYRDEVNIVDPNSSGEFYYGAFCFRSSE